MKNKTTEIKTLTVADAVELLRDYGVKMCCDTLRKGIEQGVFPFGVVISTSKGTPVYLIFEKLFDAWIEERSNA